MVHAAVQALLSAAGHGSAATQWLLQACHTHDCIEKAATPPVCVAGMDVLAPSGARPEAEHDAAAAAAAEVGGGVYGMPEQVAAAHLVAQMQQGGSPGDRAGGHARTLSDAPLVRCHAVQRAPSLRSAVGGAYADTGEPSA